uniref:Uncharacterized protein n=1 Tax=Trichuris muris TaxID=70415 RepID=A0A5S6Q9H3_TRIMR
MYFSLVALTLALCLPQVEQFNLPKLLTDLNKEVDPRSFSKQLDKTREKIAAGKQLRGKDGKPATFAWYGEGPNNMRTYHEVWFEDKENAKKVKLDDVDIEVPKDIAEEDELFLMNDQRWKVAPTDAQNATADNTTSLPLDEVAYERRSTNVVAPMANASSNDSTHLNNSVVDEETEAREVDANDSATDPSSRRKKPLNYATVFYRPENIPLMAEALKQVVEEAFNVSFQEFADIWNEEMPINKSSDDLWKELEEKTALVRTLNSSSAWSNWTDSLLLWSIQTTRDARNHTSEAPPEQPLNVTEKQNESEQSTTTSTASTMVLQTEDPLDQLLTELLSLYTAEQIVAALEKNERGNLTAKTKAATDELRETVTMKPESTIAPTPAEQLLSLLSKKGELNEEALLPQSARPWQPNVQDTFESTAYVHASQADEKEDTSPAKIDCARGDVICDRKESEAETEANEYNVGPYEPSEEPIEKSVNPEWLKNFRLLFDDYFENAYDSHEAKELVRQSYHQPRFYYRTNRFGLYRKHDEDRDFNNDYLYRAYEHQ